MSVPEEERPDELPPCDFVVFGGTGDLALRKLLPALYLRELEGHLSRETRIFSVSRRPFAPDEYRSMVGAALERHVPASAFESVVAARLLERLQHIALDAADPSGWHELAGALKDRPGERQVARIFYLAVAPSMFGPICERVDEVGLVDEHSRVVMEKPIGHDLASARRVNEVVGRVFDEGQIYRIDHYLGKESVQNLLVTRFANTFLEPVWNSNWVDHVQITAAESLGVGARGGYYDDAGALRDMVQNHLLQLLCLVAMEPPTYVDRETVRDEKLKVLKALRPLTGGAVDASTVRGVYEAATIDGKQVASYATEVGDADTTTETFVAIEAEIDNWRWAGVPFYLRTGKRMDRHASEVVVVFKKPPVSMFPAATGTTTPNRLHVILQPDEGMRLHLTAKEPGPGGYRLRPVSLDLSYATTFEQRLPDAYERLIMDVMKGNPTLFMRRDEVEAAWQWIEPILQHWQTVGGAPLPYAAGTSGPAAAASMLERSGRTWQEAHR